MHTLPSAPIFVTTALGIVWSVKKFRFDAFGRSVLAWKHGHESRGTGVDCCDVQHHRRSVTTHTGATSDSELVTDAHEHFATRADARAAVFEWLVWYDADRLHSALEYRPPVEYEEHLTNHLHQAA